MVSVPYLLFPSLERSISVSGSFQALFCCKSFSMVSVPYLLFSSLGRFVPLVSRDHGGGNGILG